MGYLSAGTNLIVFMFVEGKTATSLTGVATRGPERRTSVLLIRIHNFTMPSSWLRMDLDMFTLVLDHDEKLSARSAFVNCTQKSMKVNHLFIIEMATK